MKNKISLTAALMALLLLGSAPARAAQEVVAGVVILIKGTPNIKRRTGGAVKPLKMNQFVNEGDQIITEAGEYASIAFVSGAEIRISEKSNFAVESGGGQKATQLFVSIGKAWTRMLNANHHGGINIRTPTAVAAVRGTEADVESGDRTTVKVYDGLVDVYNDHGKQSLVAGQMTQVASAATAPEPPKTMSAEDKQTWQDSLKATGVDKQLDRLQAEGERRRTLELTTKDGKKIKINLKKK